jgi:hypothetical protein
MRMAAVCCTSCRSASRVARCNPCNRSSGQASARPSRELQLLGGAVPGSYTARLPVVKARQRSLGLPHFLLHLHAPASGGGGAKWFGSQAQVAAAAQAMEPAACACVCCGVPEGDRSCPPQTGQGSGGSARATPLCHAAGPRARVHMSSLRRTGLRTPPSLWPLAAPASASLPPSLLSPARLGPAWPQTDL